MESNILSLTDFKRNSSQVLKRVKKDKSPAVLTVNGAASVVVIDAAVYQEMKNNAYLGSLIKGIEKGLNSMEKNTGMTAQEAFCLLKEKNGRAEKMKG